MFVEETHKHKLSIALLMVLGLLALFLAVKTIAEIKGLRFIGGGVPITNTITVTGEGEVFAVPDVGQFTFSVVVEKSTVAEAQEEATQKANEAIELLKNRGVEEKDIKTVGYNVYPRYDYVTQSCIVGQPCPPGRQVLRGYEVRQTISVKIRDTKQAGELLGAMGGIGVQEISGLNFTVDDETALMEEARREAIADAKAKAEQLADDLGVRLVRVVSFSESGQPFYPLPYAVTESALGRGGAADAASVPDVPTGENSIISKVSITYEIR